MIRDDYLLRLIEQFGRAIRALVKGRDARRYEQAERMVDEASRLVTGLSFWAVRSLSVKDLLLRMTNPGGLEAHRASMVGHLMLEAGVLEQEQGRDDAAAPLYERALQLTCAAFDADPSLEDEAGRQRVEDIGYRLVAPSLPACALLMRRYDKYGRFGRAEDLLFVLAENGWSEAPALASSFYERLLAADEDALEAGGLPRSEVIEGQAEISKLLPQS